MVVSSQAHCSLDLDSGIKDWSATQIVESEVLLNQEGITTQKVVHVFWLHFDAPIDESFYSDRVFETQTSCSFHQKPSDFHSIIIGLSHNLISLLIKSPKGVLVSVVPLQFFSFVASTYFSNTYWTMYRDLDRSFNTFHPLFVVLTSDLFRASMFNPAPSCYYHK